jgi:glycerol kinase
LAIGYWENIEELKEQWHIDKVFTPKLDKEKVDELQHNWEKALDRAKGWDK